jgi:glucose-6-phosphate dehydrogenase assembly protein OpcA
VAQTLRNTSVAEIERRLDDLRDCDVGWQRTSVATHMAWVPPEWTRAVDRVVRGLGSRIPSRTLLLRPQPDATEDGLDAVIEREHFDGQARVSAEIVRIRLRGRTAAAPASVVVPLQLPDLPVFLRWRGRPPFRRPQFEDMVGVADRLIVDSAEWGDRLRPAYRRLSESFDRICISDIAWGRSLGFRAGLAALWPGIRNVRVLEVRGPRADAALLHGWLCSRLKANIRLRHVDARSLSRVAVDGQTVRAPRRLTRSFSDQLSDQLEVYTRDRIYEAAVRAV